MTEVMKGHLPVVRIQSNESICYHTPDILCKVFEDCNSCPFNDSRKNVAVMLIIEREPDHEKN